MTVSVTPEMIFDEIESVHYFTASEGEAGSEFAFSLDDCPVEKSGYNALAAYQSAPTPLDYLTFCVIVLKNGYTVTGQSACVDPSKYDRYMGRQIAFNDAKDKVWALLGFRLKDGMHT